ncbi:unnamed protein product [Linum tenue]|uniref:BRCT domain-containing protein n=1 Tax=Linum tenue TaxID=586396 RepID=A0AAV0KJD3_9ROSI|nr:unnamed protein product [Linum tenue]
MTSFGFRQPQFSEELAYLPIWLQKPQPEPSPPPGNSIAEAEVPFSSNRELRSLWPPRGSSTCFGKDVNRSSKDEGRYKDCCLFLSGEANSESTVAPSPGNLLHLRLHISLDGDSPNTQCQLSYPSDLPRGSSMFESQHQDQTLCSWDEKACQLKVDYNGGGVTLLPPASTPGVVKSGSLQVPSINQGSKMQNEGKLNVFPANMGTEAGSLPPKHSSDCEDGDINGAIELSIAASEALVIHELMKTELSSEGFSTGSILEAALRVKQARLLEEGMEDEGYSNYEVDEVDSLADLDDSVMRDAFMDVGLSLDCAHVSGSDISHVKETPMEENFDGSTNGSKVPKDQQDQNINGKAPDSDYSGMACSGNRSSYQQEDIPHDMAEPQEGNANGGKQRTRKGVAKYFIDEASFLSESADMAVNQISGMLKKGNGPNIASQSSINFNGLQDKAHDAVLPSEEVRCSYVSASDPLCSIVPCSIPMEEHVVSPANQIQNGDGVEPQNCFGHKFLPGLGNECTIDKVEEQNPDSPLNGNDNVDIENQEDTCVSVQRRSPIVLNRRTRHRLQARESFIGSNVPAVRCLEQDLPESTTIKFDISNQTNMPSGEVVSCPENNLVRTKRVHFSFEVQHEQTKELIQRSKASSVGDLGIRDNKRSKLSKPSCMKKCLLGHKQDLKRLIFHRWEFLITGFSYTKERELGGMIQKSGGIVLSEIPSHRSSRFRGIKRSDTQQLTLVISSKKLQTAKFLYGCAVNAPILKARWITDSIAAGSIAPPEKYVIRPNQADIMPVRLLSMNQNTGPRIFDRVGIMLHGKPSFCRKLSLIVKHGGGEVFKSLQTLLLILDTGKLRRGVIVAENQSRALRHLQHCASEQKIALMPASWIAKSLHLGKLLPVQEKEDDAPQEIGLQTSENSLDWSQEF